MAASPLSLERLAGVEKWSGSSGFHSCRRLAVANRPRLFRLLLLLLPGCTHGAWRMAHGPPERQQPWHRSIEPQIFVQTRKYANTQIHTHDVDAKDKRHQYI